MLNRLYDRYRKDPAFSRVRGEAGGVLVPGDGPMSPRLLLVGEAPGSREAALRKPFVGDSGRLLDELLASVEIDRSEVFITNTVKYRPYKNRDPDHHEVVSGVAYLWAEHSLLGFPPIVALGRHARMALGLPERVPVGKWVWHERYPVLPLHHPAYAIYQRANRPKMFEQFKAVLDPPASKEECLAAQR